MNRFTGKIISMVVAIMVMMLSYSLMRLFITNSDGIATIILIMIAFMFGLTIGKIVRRELVE